VAESYVLSPAELAMLEQAARTADELDRLERAVRALPELTTTGSTGQLKPHPFLAEVRAHRQLLERLTTIKTWATVGRPGMRAARLEPAGGHRTRKPTGSLLSLERSPNGEVGDGGDASHAA
jgi:hypothetical protein